jgi:hypothetical protein
VQVHGRERAERPARVDLHILAPQAAAGFAAVALPRQREVPAVGAADGEQAGVGARRRARDAAVELGLRQNAVLGHRSPSTPKCD